MVCKFEEIISLENLLEAWREFLPGKRHKKDVARFSLHLMNNLVRLHRELLDHTYRHGGYQAFKISDPKPRDIHKATVRDRLLHHAIYRILYPYFDRKFIFDSYSCRLGKGTHRAINRFHQFFHKISQNNTKTCWVLKCDVRKFFASIDHKVLLAIIKDYVPDKNILWLLVEVIKSFPDRTRVVGLPLGNLTSQLLVNIYMNRFDQFVKHDLKVRHFVRFADDFVILSDNKINLEKTLELVRNYLRNNLKLELHPNKVSISTFASGVDFLGIVNFPNYRVLRTKTKKRMFTKIQCKRNCFLKGIVSADSFSQSISSYLGLLKHCNGYEVGRKILYGCK